MNNIRKGVIIAAGNGSRLCPPGSSLPKPLIKVAGVPLIERVILTGKKAGLKNFVIVLGFKGEMIQRYLVAQQQRLGVTLEFVWNPDWKKANGFSVLQAESLVGDEFVLMMSDHIIEYAGLEKFLQHAVSPGEVILATDSRLNEIFDLDDATRVLESKGQVQAIGKDLSDYNAVDTGFFLCSSELFAALRIVCEQGEGSLTEAIRILAGKGRVRTASVGPCFWQDVDSPETLKHAERRLFSLVAKAKPTDGFISRHFNRKISGWISSILVRTAVTPNQITYSALFFGLVSALLVAKGDYLHVALGGILFQFCSIYDGCDGEIAKLKLRSSKFGEWLDTICDNVTYVAFFIGIVLGLYRQGASSFVLSLGMVVVVSVLLTLVMMYVYLRRYSNSGSLVAIQVDLASDLKHARGFVSRALNFLYPFAKRDFFALLFMFFALLNHLDWILFATFVGSQMIWIVMLTMRKNVAHALAPVHRLQED